MQDSGVYKYKLAYSGHNILSGGSITEWSRALECDRVLGLNAGSPINWLCDHKQAVCVLTHCLFMYLLMGVMTVPKLHWVTVGLKREKPCTGFSIMSGNPCSKM